LIQKDYSVEADESDWGSGQRESESSTQLYVHLSEVLAGIHTLNEISSKLAQVWRMSDGADDSLEKAGLKF
jgi:hypothetical protein